MDTLLLNSDGMPLSQVPLSVITWTKAIYLLYLDKVRILKEYDNWTVRSQHLEMKVPSIVIMTEHVRWDRGLKYSSNNIFLRDDSTCQLQTTWRCKEQHGKVKLSELTLDHVVPRSKGGKTTWTNCCTACKECNSSKGNDETIVPKKKPYLPSYYEMLAKRKKFPIHVRDADWMHYIDWPAELVRVQPQPGYNGK
jgi:5-methylcytosine-specific restriction endonuclease McrA